MKLKRFGFFSSMNKDEAVDLLKTVSSTSPREHESDVLNYLRGGTQVFMVPGLAVDLLNPEHVVIGPPNVFTDGEWTWSNELLFYIEHYHIEIPTAFLQKMSYEKWVCPAPHDLQELDCGLWQ